MIVKKKAPGRRRKWLVGGILAAILLVGLTGCQSLGYYKQAIQGQCRIYWAQHSIEKVVKDPRTPEALKEKLGLVLELRKFADRELHLPPNGHYLKYADLQRRFVVWNVYAAPELSLEPKRWWYPLVGSLKYRGYFSELHARKYATNLIHDGYDVFVGGVEAYSTLGWFHDPVLNTFIHHTPADLAEIIFHELTHQKVFAKGDTDFNEALATAVAEEGVRRWLETRGDTNALRQYVVSEQRNEQFVQLVTDARNQLKQLYGDVDEGEAKGGAAPAVPDEVKRREKEKILDNLKLRYAKMKADWGGYAGYDNWFGRPINNAQLNTIAAYYDLVPYFQRLLQSEHGDLKKFYKAAQKLADMHDKDARHEALKRLAGET